MAVQPGTNRIFIVSKAAGGARLRRPDHAQHHRVNSS